MTTTVQPGRSACWLYEVDPYEIHYLKFILEAYEGLATLTTLNADKGLIRLAVPPGCEGSLDALMKALEKELKLNQVSAKERGEEFFP